MKLRSGSLFSGDGNTFSPTLVFSLAFQRVALDMGLDRCWFHCLANSNLDRAGLNRTVIVGQNSHIAV